jgi:hypothetical protein
MCREYPHTDIHTYKDGMEMGIDNVQIFISKTQFLQSGKDMPQKLGKAFVFTIWSFWRGEPRSLQLNFNS